MDWNTMAKSNVRQFFFASTNTGMQGSLPSVVETQYLVRLSDFEEDS